MDYIRKYWLPALITLIASTAVYIQATNPELMSFGDEDNCANVEYVEGTQAELIGYANIEAEVGELIEIDLSESKARTFKWEIQPHTENCRIIECGRKMILSHGKRGRFKIFVACALDDTLDSAVIEIKVAGSAPTPDDNDDEDDGEDNQPDPPESELNQLVSNWVSEIDTPEKQSETRALAQSFRSVSAMVSAGVVKSLEDLIDMTKASNQTALGDSLDDWKPFSDGLRKYLNKLGKEGELGDLQDHASIWEQIGDSLSSTLN